MMRRKLASGFWKSRQGLTSARCCFRHITRCGLRRSFAVSSWRVSSTRARAHSCTGVAGARRLGRPAFGSHDAEVMRPLFSTALALVLHGDMARPPRRCDPSRDQPVRGDRSSLQSGSYFYLGRDVRADSPGPYGGSAARRAKPTPGSRARVRSGKGLGIVHHRLGGGCRGTARLWYRGNSCSTRCGAGHGNQAGGGVFLRGAGRRLPYRGGHLGGTCCGTQRDSETANSTLAKERFYEAELLRLEAEFVRATAAEAERSVALLERAVELPREAPG